MAKADLTAQRLRELLHYDPETGVFTWLVAKGSAAPSGRRAGTIHRGYRRITINGVHHYEHRLAWFYVHGKWPTDQIDHENRVKDTNHISNLRPATHAEQQQNRGIRSNNTSGYPGVSWHSQTGKWVAYINADGKRKHLGMFPTAGLAAAAYLGAKAGLHPFAAMPAGDVR